MKCPKCQYENREGAKFCLKCGEKFEVKCPNCGNSLPSEALFCDECGHTLAKLKEAPPIDYDQSQSYAPGSQIDTIPTTPSRIEGERKHVTVLFSDMSGYTAMSERLDPEDVKEITSRIFGRISKVIGKYEGFVEKFVGDAVMALFGVPKTHEDDPVRAIRAAREIHDLVEALSPELEERVGRPLSMHTGVNTGLVVTGEVDMEKGTHGVAGDTINLASRLSSLAKAGEILVGPDTYRWAEGHFTFENLEPTTVKGKAEPIQIHKVLSAKEKPVTVHRLFGLRADLIGRKAEIAQLGEAIDNLREGKGRIFSVCGDAGTGKSRLIEEFKNTLDLKEIQWFEGHAYSYSQSIPFAPLIDLLNEVFQIQEGDPPERVRERIDSEIEHLVGKKEDIVPYVGGLYALSYPEVENISPESWKSGLQDALLVILSALAQRAPTVFLLEDLHWADPSFVELLRHALLEIRQPAIVLCVYRPIFSLLSSHQLSGIAKIYQEIRLQDLSLSEAQDMLESLLKTETIPSDLKRFVQDKAEGNPFYLEELVNSLIESETLVRDNVGWKLARTITESQISSTLHGLISGRLDGLEKETKRILQEASVIGRTFLYDILRRVTSLKQDIDRSIRGLEQLDLIRTRAFEPDLEYIFKHALTQEVVYEGLLKTERSTLHERIALEMEQIFNERIPEFYETLAFHFSRGQSISKAVHYLIKSGEKSFNRYALEESHQFFKNGYEILSKKADKSLKEKRLFITLLCKWAYVYERRGDFKGLLSIFLAHEMLAKSLDDKGKAAMFYAWIGFGLQSRERLRDSYNYLNKALAIGEEAKNTRVIGYSCAWLARTCADLGLLDEAIDFVKRAQEMSGVHKSDQDLFRFSFAETGHAYFFKGDCRKTEEAGKSLLHYGHKHSEVRCTAIGHQVVGWSHFAAGDFPSAIECFQRTTETSVDPMDSYFAKFMLGLSYVIDNQVQKAEKTLEDVLSISEIFGLEFLGTSAQGLQSAVLLAKGNLKEGVRISEAVIESFIKNESKWRVAIANNILGNVYLQIVQRAGPKTLSFLAKNIQFLIKNLPVASKKSEAHFSKTIKVAEEIGAKSILGQAYLGLGLLHKTKKRNDKARECISKAIQLFEICHADVYLKQAKEALTSLG